jgi:hypothetical protein
VTEETVTELPGSIQGEQEQQHGWQRASEADVDDDGLFLRKLTCTCCGLVVKIEKWSGTTRLGRRSRFERVGSRLEYQTGPEGQTYLAPSGRGHMTPRMIGDSIASKALAGQSLAALRKAANRAETRAGSSSNASASRVATGTG